MFVIKINKMNLCGDVKMGVLTYQNRALAVNHLIYDRMINMHIFVHVVILMQEKVLPYLIV